MDRVRQIGPPRWFHALVWESAQAVYFWRGRLRFVGAPSSAPFPSAAIYSDDLRKSLTRLFASIRKKAPRVSAELDHQLLARVQDALDQLALEAERVSSAP